MNNRAKQHRYKMSELIIEKWMAVLRGEMRAIDAQQYTFNIVGGLVQQIEDSLPKTRIDRVDWDEVKADSFALDG